MFSKRMGLVEEPIFQKDSISQALANKLWIICGPYISNICTKREQTYIGDFINKFRPELFIIKFALYFSLDVDGIPVYDTALKDYIKRTFFNIRNWNRIYDIIEFLLEYKDSETIRISLNKILEQENSAYRLNKENIFVPITNDEELEEINNILEVPYAAVTEHIKTAIGYIKAASPDYRNSIKESISAVEAICCIITGDSSASLGASLKKLKDSGLIIHPALEQGVSKIYGYASNDGGIRHAMTDPEENPTFDEAKYMLVSCSAFVNYLMSKYEKIPK